MISPQTHVYSELFIEFNFLRMHIILSPYNKVCRPQLAYTKLSLNLIKIGMVPVKFHGAMLILFEIKSLLLHIEHCILLAVGALHFNHMDATVLTTHQEMLQCREPLG